MKKQSASGFRIAKHLRMMKKLLICNRKMPAVYHLLDNSVSSLIRMVTFAAVGGSTTRLSTSRPSFHPFTDLVIQDAHYNQLHAGVNATVTAIRQKFWMPAVRQSVKSTTLLCHMSKGCRKTIPSA